LSLVQTQPAVPTPTNWRRAAPDRSGSREVFGGGDAHVNGQDGEMRWNVMVSLFQVGRAPASWRTPTKKCGVVARGWLAGGRHSSTVVANVVGKEDQQSALISANDIRDRYLAYLWLESSTAMRGGEAGSIVTQNQPGQQQPIGHSTTPTRRATERSRYYDYKNILCRVSYFESAPPLRQCSILASKRARLLTYGWVGEDAKMINYHLWG